MASENKAQSDAPKVKRAPPPALNPESMALVQPWKDFVSKGLITELTAKFSPLGTQVFCKVNSSLIKEGDGNAISIGDAKDRIIKANLWTPGQRKEKNGANKGDVLPKKSLTKKDFEETTDAQLAERAKAVALALTDTTARGRIGSLKLMQDGVDTFEKWWAGAPPEWKSRLLADSKHWKELSEIDHAKLARSIPEPPFRGTVPTPSPEEEEKKKEGESAANPAKPERRKTPPQSKK